MSLPRSLRKSVSGFEPDLLDLLARPLCLRALSTRSSSSRDDSELELPSESLLVLLLRLSVSSVSNEEDDPVGPSSSRAGTPSAELVAVVVPWVLSDDEDG